MVDTLIVGGGTAGCVLAARSSADADHTVRLLEAGPAWSTPAEIPAELLDATRMPIGPQSPWLWRYPGGIVRGRVIGGSSTINGSYFVRAPASDFAAWSRGLGSSTWSFDAVLPDYVRLERDLDYGADPGHGRSGPIPIRRISRPVPLSAEFASACVAAGYRVIADLNALPGTEPAEGIGSVPCNIEDDRRVGTGSGYLLPVLSRPNLTVSAGTLVTRIRFAGNRAVGVDCLSDGASSTVWADRIILCAGAIESAALLLRSGIGAPEDLRALGIPVIHPAPVGAWCTDHPEIGIEYLMDAGQSAPETVPLEYVLEIDDIEIRPYTVSFNPGEQRLGVALMRQESVGVLRLLSADPAEPPRIDHRYLSAEHDRTRLREAVAAATEVLGGMRAHVPRPMPRTTEAAGAWLRANLGTSQHLSGTCRMGHAGDEQAVVDERCRVHGVTGLSVVDLSIVPVPLGRGPQATTVMLAEHAVENLTP